MIRDNRRQQAYDYIRAKILTADVDEGQRIAEIPLAKELGISRTPVREALNQLASEGLLDRSGWGVAVKQISLGELDEMIRLRQLMEPHAAARAAKLITPDQLTILTERFDHLRALYRQMWDAGVESWRGELGRQLPIADMLFHIAILEAARSPRLMQTILDLRLLTTRFRGESSMQQDNLIRLLREHWRIYHAIRQRKPRAAKRAMRLHNRECRRISMNGFRHQQQRGDAERYTHDWSASLQKLMQTPNPTDQES